MKRCFAIEVILGCLLLPAAGRSAEDQKAATANARLGKEVLAFLQAHCVRCHNAEKPKAKLNLTNLDGVSRGGKGGAVVSPGKPDDSLLWQLVGAGRMPPKKPLPQAERGVLRRWIENGAPGLTIGARSHWAFRLPIRPPLPVVRRPTRLRTAIDHFIVAALENKGLAPNPETDRATLVRRVSFDLTGLPPSPAEIDAFQTDRSPAAYETMVERYLASPHYGERWGKYWLDAAGYADSNGYFNADSDRPLAYHYRDYVINAFNGDKPYDCFVREQLAGDDVAGYVCGGDVTPAMVEPLTATHFLRNAPDGTGESDGNPDEVRTDRYSVLEGNLQITMNCLLGLTIQCARCHAHKFEPITHADYYSLQAVFFAAYNPDRWIAPKNRVVVVADKARREEQQRHVARLNRQVNVLRASLRTIAEPLREQLLEERLRNLESSLRMAVLRAVATPREKLTAEQAQLLKKHVELVKIGDEDVAKRFPEYASLRDQIEKAVARWKHYQQPLADLFARLPDPPEPAA